jgi:hypothetical protein
MKYLNLLFLPLSLTACSGTTSTPPSTTPTEFVASAADFANYTTWTQNGAPRHGVDPSGLLKMGAHGGNDTNVIRTIYMNPSNPQRDAGGHFPTGTILLKESGMKGQTPMMVTAMAKRGGSYNSDGNGWEFFMLSSGQIMGRGDTLMGGMCKSCHAGAGASKDDVFTR